MSYILNPNRVGIHVFCTTCRNSKAPIGRSAPIDSYLCDRDCPGYDKAPFAGSLWPGETEADFGHHVGVDGTEIRLPATQPGDTSK